MILEIDYIAGRLETYLSGRLADDDISVTDLKRHAERWSRQTMSFAANWTEMGIDRSKRLVARVEPVSGQDRPLDYRNDVDTEFETRLAMYEAGMNVSEPYWFEDDTSVLSRLFFLVGHRPGSVPVTWNLRDRHTLYESWICEGKRLSDQFGDAIANIHELDADDVNCLKSRGLIRS